MFSSLKAIEKDRQEREERDFSGDAQKLVQSGFLNKLIGSSKAKWDIEVKK